MSEEVLMINMLSGITCPDGRHFQELVCSGKDGKDVRVVLPVSHPCGDNDCESCTHNDVCDSQDTYEVDFGRKLIIKRFD